MRIELLQGYFWYDVPFEGWRLGTSDNDQAYCAIQKHQILRPTLLCRS